MRPTVKLQEGVFITDFPGYTLLVQSVNGRTNEMRGVTIYQMNPGGPPTTIIARRGFLSYSPNGRDAALELENGEIHEIPSDEAGAARYRRMVFKTHTITIAGAGGMLERTVRNSRSDREMSAKDLISERDSMVTQYRMAAHDRALRLAAIGVPRGDLGMLTPEREPFLKRVRTVFAGWSGRPDELELLAASRTELRPEIELWRRERDGYRRRIAGLAVEVHKKFSLPAACIVFVLLGTPIGMRVRRAGPAVAFVSVAFFLFYYLCLIGGEELANRLLIAPWLAMWLPNIVLGTWGVIWTLQACEIRIGRSRALATLPRPAAATP
jgi:lipopolysaccharide export system permease protein